MNAEELKSNRKKLGLTQEELANKIGVHRSHISQWESGVYQVSKVYTKILEDFFKKQG